MLDIHDLILADLIVWLIPVVIALVIVLLLWLLVKVLTAYERHKSKGGD